MKPFKVAAILRSQAVLGIPAVVLIASDGEAWKVHTAYHKRTMLPIKLGDVVEVAKAALPEAGRETVALGWYAEGYECPSPLPKAPPDVAAAAWQDAPAPAPKPAAKGCEGCDCADPTAAPGLAADCDCRCHAPPPKEKYDEVGAILDFENGDLDAGSTLVLFAHLIRNGHAWTLQGSYGRAAARFIEAGYIDRKGNILREIEE